MPKKLWLNYGIFGMLQPYGHWSAMVNHTILLWFTMRLNHARKGMVQPRFNHGVLAGCGLWLPLLVIRYPGTRPGSLSGIRVPVG